MRQLLLGLDAQAPASFDTFIVGQNTELLQRLTLIADDHGMGADNPAERSIYLWGEAGAGKTHLLQALAARSDARYIGTEASPTDFNYASDIKLYLLDDCDALTPEAQIDAFALFNEVRARGGVLLAAGLQAPLALALREDLRTRLGWGLIYQVHGLSDDDKISALERMAQARNIKLPEGVLPYLITHYRRDMPWLTQMLGQLDQYSLEQKRPITLPLLRELLQQASAENHIQTPSQTHE
jgi:DnaA family protein